MIRLATSFAIVMAAGAAMSLSSTWGPRESQKMTLSAQTWTWHKLTLLEAAAQADSLGIHVLEVYPGQSIGGNYPGAFTITLPAEVRPRLCAELKALGVRVAALGVIDKEYYSLQNLEAYFAFARDMGIGYITAEPERADLDLFDSLGRRYGVRVGLHCHPRPHSRYWQPDSMLAAIRGRAFVGAWPDVGHWARSGVAVLPALKKMEGKLWGMHLKDIKAVGNVHTPDTLLGRGVCNVPSILAELRRQRFAGIVSVEYEAHENDNRADMRANAAYIQAAFGR